MDDRDVVDDICVVEEVVVIVGADELSDNGVDFDEDC